MEKMMELFLQELNSHRCIPYIKDRLDQMLYFSNRISHELDLEKGKFYTITPKEIGGIDLYNFKTGGKVFPYERAEGVQVLQSINHCDNIILSSLYAYLAKDQSHCICMEDYTAAPDHKYVKESNRRYQLINGRVFYLMDNTYSPAKVKEYFTQANWFGFLCLLFRAPSGLASLKLSPNAALGDQAKEIVFNGIQAFLVEIYDGESYLIWIGDQEGGVFLDHISAKLKNEQNKQ